MVLRRLPIKNTFINALRLGLEVLGVACFGSSVWGRIPAFCGLWRHEDQGLGHQFTIKSAIINKVQLFAVTVVWPGVAGNIPGDWTPTKGW